MLIIMTKKEEEDKVATMSKAMESNNFISTRPKGDKSCALSHLSLFKSKSCLQCINSSSDRERFNNKAEGR